MLNNELEVLNLILRKLGEPPINSVDTQYPTLDLIRPALADAQSALLQEGWWFNTIDRYAAVPALDGTVTVPPDTLAFYPEDPRWSWIGSTVVAVDGNPYVGTVVYGRRVFDRDFYTLPIAARKAIVYSATLQVYAEDIGVDNIHSSIGVLFSTAYTELSAQHTRQRKLTSMQKPQVLRWRHHLRS